MALDKDGLLGPKKDKYKVCSLLNKAPPNFGSSVAFSCQFCQAFRYQNRSKGLDPNLGEDKDGLLGPKKDKYKVCSLLHKAPPNFGSTAAFSCQFCQALKFQIRSKGFVCHYINIDTMG